MKVSKTIFCLAGSATFAFPAFATAADQIIRTSATTTITAPEVADPAKSAPETQTDQNNSPFVSLIAEQGLDGWLVHEGKESAWKREGEMISCLSSTGGWLRTKAEYSDFVVRLEYRLQAGGNTGIGIRAPSVGNPTFTSLEVQLLDDSAPKYADLRADQYTGSIYYQVAATSKAKLQRLGEWNQCEIRCLGDELTIKINGEVVNQVQLARRKDASTPEQVSPGGHLLSQRPPMGHLALQSHSTRVDFRKIEIQDLTVRTPSGLQYVDLAVGEGEVVGDAKSVTLHYVGQLASGKRFTDTRDVGSPVPVSLQDVIPGLQEGIQGMKLHGRRRLIVPAHLGYGTAGVAKVVPPDATLVFEVEICGISR
ncbi:family 16 glycoside hydrolase [Planctomicrobium sp. SH661]|uniref:family 16 glycoside hydrolase n=1 Tax=Planctomicrobium sp. SH661 TaxID=3448124 RepID=UPI003F5B887E